MRKKINEKKGATFIIWIFVIGTFLYALLGSLMTGNTNAYRDGIDFYRRMQAMYIAEGGIAKAIAEMKNGDVASDKNITLNLENGMAQVVCEKSGDSIIIKSSGKIKNGNAVWEERIKTELDSSDLSKIKNYYWMGRNEK